MGPLNAPECRAITVCKEESQERWPTVSNPSARWWMAARCPWQTYVALFCQELLGLSLPHGFPCLLLLLCEVDRFVQGCRRLCGAAGILEPRVAGAGSIVARLGARALGEDVELGRHFCLVIGSVGSGRRGDKLCSSSVGKWISSSQALEKQYDYMRYSKNNDLDASGLDNPKLLYTLSACTASSRRAWQASILHLPDRPRATQRAHAGHLFALAASQIRAGFCSLDPNVLVLVLCLSVLLNRPDSEMTRSESNATAHASQPPAWPVPDSSDSELSSLSLVVFISDTKRRPGGFGQPEVV
jgi:hypothetical protein